MDTEITFPKSQSTQNDNYPPDASEKPTDPRLREVFIKNLQESMKNADVFARGKMQEEINRHVEQIAKEKNNVDETASSL